MTQTTQILKFRSVTCLLNTSWLARSFCLYLLNQFIHQGQVTDQKTISRGHWVFLNSKALPELSRRDLKKRKSSAWPHETTASSHNWIQRKLLVASRDLRPCVIEKTKTLLKRHWRETVPHEKSEAAAHSLPEEASSSGSCHSSRWS